MKLVILLALVAVVAARPDSYYDTKYDNFNMDEVLGNKKLMENYAHCFIGDGKCTAEGKDIKKLIPEATTSSCARCTEKQRVLAAKAIKGIQVQLPTEYAILIKKHDPENKYGEELKKFMEKYSS